MVTRSWVHAARIGLGSELEGSREDCLLDKIKGMVGKEEKRSQVTLAIVLHFMFAFEIISNVQPH